jgi:hypothetical protein
MDMGKYYVEIYERKTGKVGTRMGPMPYGKAERVQRGAEINMNHKDYAARIVAK